jgi:hypothetical protein
MAMTSLQAPFAYPAGRGGADPRPHLRPSWAARLLSWWRGGGPHPLVLSHVAPRLPGAADVGAGRPSLGEIGAVIATAALQRPGGLMNAYVASAVDVALEAEALGDGTPARRVRTPIHDLVAEVADALQPCAKAAGATLAYDRDSRWSCVAITDPGRLRKALTHLILRAMSGAEAGVLVRVVVAAEPAATRIGVMAVRSGPEPGLFDLAALVRLVQAIGGAVVVEPLRAGCIPISIVLPAPVAAAPALAYGSRPAAVRSEVRR